MARAISEHNKQRIYHDKISCIMDARNSCSGDCFIETLRVHLKALSLMILTQKIKGFLWKKGLGIC